MSGDTWLRIPFFKTVGLAKDNAREGQERTQSSSPQAQRQ